MIVAYIQTQATIACKKKTFLHDTIDTLEFYILNGEYTSEQLLINLKRCYESPNFKLVEVLDNKCYKVTMNLPDEVLVLGDIINYELI